MAKPEVAVAAAVDVAVAVVVGHVREPIVVRNAAVALVVAEPAVGPDAALAAGFVAFADVADVADAGVAAAVVPASAHSVPAQHLSNCPC